MSTPRYPKDTLDKAELSALFRLQTELDGERETLVDYIGLVNSVIQQKESAIEAARPKNPLGVSKISG